MTKQISDEEFIATWRELGSPQAISKQLDLNIRTVYRRRNYLLTQGIALQTNLKNSYNKEEVEAKVKARIEATRLHARRGITMEKGKVVVFSDAHFYPNDKSTAFRALLEYIKEFKPEVIINRSEEHTSELQSH